MLGFFYEIYNHKIIVISLKIDKNSLNSQSFIINKIIQHMSKTATIELDGNKYEFPVIVGTENEVAIDIEKLRGATGAITIDPGYKNTGSCKSEITFLDGEEGILRYRGYSIEDLAEKADFLEVSYLLIFGELPLLN